jgi:hypothetical protein
MFFPNYFRNSLGGNAFFLFFTIPLAAAMADADLKIGEQRGNRSVQGFSRQEPTEY